MYDFIDPTLISKYAKTQPEIWKNLTDLLIRHKKLGMGTIRNVDVHPDGSPRLWIEFEGEHRKREFNKESFTDGFFTEVEVTAAVQAAIQRSIQVEEKIEESRRHQEELKDRFQILRRKYGLGVNAPFSSLEAMESLDAGNPLTDGELISVKNNDDLKPLIFVHHQRVHQQIAENLEYQYRLEGDPWDAVQAGSYWRKAGHPKRNLEIVRSALAAPSLVHNSPVVSALLTTLGGGYRDLGMLDEAERHARDAIRLPGKKCYPYNLLGAILFQKGDLAEGIRAFQAAEEAGGCPNGEKSEIQHLLETLTPEDAADLINALYALNPDRYSWLNSYRSQSIIIQF